MPFINAAIMEGAGILARAVDHEARQAVSSAVSTTMSTLLSTTVAAASTSLPSPTLLPTSSSATSAASSTDSALTGTQTGNSSSNSTSQSSPLLFFVALGFGVVFTNLWIIVGVKYCFRYNSRSRQMRMAEDGEPINLEAMPRPHRRRREKKLMTIDEVNEKFPMMKYKSWVALRAQDGLPTRGGVSAPTSRANSVREVEGVVEELPSKERESTDDQPRTSSATKPGNPEETNRPQHATKESTSSDIAPVVTATDTLRPQTARGGEELPRVTSHISADEEEDDEHINAAIPPECLGTSGDTCAICIDALEDDDDVRGLTCGHAFHAVCLDPWLTSRRACCPLCKADYYVPKPRPIVVGEAGDTANMAGVPMADARNNRMDLPARPNNVWMYGLRGRGRIPFPTRFIITPSETADRQPSRPVGDGVWPFRPYPHQERHRRAARNVSRGAEVTQSPSGRRLPNLRFALPRFRRQAGQTEEVPAAQGTQNGVSPSQLESGTAADASR